MSAIIQCLDDCYQVCNTRYLYRGIIGADTTVGQPDLYLVTPRISPYFEVPLLMIPKFLDTFKTISQESKSVSLAAHLSPPERAVNYKSLETCICKTFYSKDLIQLPSATSEHCSSTCGIILNSNTAPLVLCTWAFSFNEENNTISFLYPVMHLNPLIYRLDPNPLTRFISGKMLTTFLSTTYIPPSVTSSQRGVFKRGGIRCEPRVLIDLDISQPFIHPAVPDATTTTCELLSTALEHVSEL